MKMKKVFAYLCIFAMIVSLVAIQAACQNQPTTTAPSGTTKQTTAGPTTTEDSQFDDKGVSAIGFPVVKDTITLKVLASKHPYQIDWNEMVVVKEYEKMTNIRVEFTNVPDDVWGERRNLILSSGDLPDMIIRSGLSDADVANFAKQGVLLKLNDLIDNYAPHLNNDVFAKYPSLKGVAGDSAGEIYSLHSYYNYEPHLQYPMWYNTDVLKALNMQAPTTTDQYLDFCTRVVNENPLGKNIVAVSHWSQGLGFYLVYFAGSFGLGTKGMNYAFSGIDLDPSGKIRYYKTDDKYKQMLQYLNKLWAMGAIDPNTFTHSNADFTAMGKNQNPAGFASWFHNTVSDCLNEDNIKVFESVPQLIGPNGDQFVSFTRSGISRNNTVITTTNKYPEASMRWLDYWYSDEGSAMHTWGVKGVTFEIDADGGYINTDEYDASKNPIELSRGKISPDFGGGFATFVAPTELIDRPYPKAIMESTGMNKAIAAYKRDLPVLQKTIDNGRDTYAFSAAELEIISTFTSEAGQYVTEMENKFVTGEIDFAEWDAFVAKVKELNLDAYVKAYQDAHTRYLASLG